MISGGAGFDRVSYGSADHSVHVSLNEVADDGMIGEHDNVLSDVELVGGSPQNDVLEGNGDDNSLDGAHGNDRLFGGDGDDHLGGRKDEDTLFGGHGNDTLVGGEYDDKLYGDQGDDSLIAGEDLDELFGRSGDDHLDSWDGEADSVICGDGIDVATVDAEDQVSADCETVNVLPV